MSRPAARSPGSSTATTTNAATLRRNETTRRPQLAGRGPMVADRGTAGGPWVTAARLDDAQEPGAE